MAVDDGYTVALLHMNGSDASTTFTDESGKTWTAAGNAQIDTAQSKFGGASGLFDGTGDYISTPDHADFAFGTGDVTIDFWAMYNSLPASGTHMISYMQYTDNSNFIFCSLYNNAGTYVWYFYDAGGFGGLSFTTPAAPSTSTWYHIAYVRNGSNFYFFMDGTKSSSTPTSATSASDLASSPSIAKGVAGNLWLDHNGWVDEFRISKGIARWTANFTPPTSAYAPASVGRVIWFS